MLVYIDTNVYLNLAKNEKTAKTAENLFLRSYRCEFKIVFSDLVAKEIQKHVDGGQVTALLKLLESRGKFVKVVSSEEHLKAGNYDEAHARLAKSAGADFLVTRNLKDFLPFRNLIKSKLPEDV